MGKVYLTRGYSPCGLPLKRIGDAPPEGVGPNGLTATERFLNRPHANPDAKPARDDGASARILPEIVHRSARPLHPMRDALTFGEYMPWRR